MSGSWMARPRSCTSWLNPNPDPDPDPNPNPNPNPSPKRSADQEGVLKALRRALVTSKEYAPYPYPYP